MRNIFLLVLLVLLLPPSATAQASNPTVTTCGLPASGEIVASVIYTMSDDCTITQSLSIKGNNISVTINGADHTLTYSASSLLLQPVPIGCSGNSITLNQVTIDADFVQRSEVMYVCGSLTATEATFRNANGLFFNVLDGARATLDDVLFENSVTVDFGNRRTNQATAMLITGNATFNDVVLRGNLYGAAAVRIRGPEEEDSEPALLVTKGCLWGAGNMPLTIEHEFNGLWADEDTVPCAVGREVGNGATVRAEPLPQEGGCGLPLGGLPDSGNLIASRVYNLTADCNLLGSLLITEDLDVVINGNEHTISTDVNARIELADNSTLTMDNVHLDGVRILNFGEMLLSRIHVSNLPRTAIADMGTLTICEMVAEDNKDPVVLAFFSYGEGNSIVSDSVIRNTDARRHDRAAAYDRAAIYAHGSGTSITLAGDITFENNLPRDTDTVLGGTITTRSTPVDCSRVSRSEDRSTDRRREIDFGGPTPTPQPSLTPTPQPSPTPTPPLYVHKPAEYILVQTGHDDLQWESVDIITLDKHPDLQGARFAVRLWRFIPQCVHRVLAADNLYRLAIRYQTTVAALRSLNGIVGDLLNLGQNLLLPSCVQDGSLVLEYTRICFEHQGNLVFIDASTSPPQVSALEKYMVNGTTCANIDRPGLVVFAAQDS